jgi:hypothetical protein
MVGGIVCRGNGGLYSFLQSARQPRRAAMPIKNKKTRIWTMRLYFRKRISVSPCFKKVKYSRRPNWASDGGIDKINSKHLQCGDSNNAIGRQWKHLLREPHCARSRELRDISIFKTFLLCCDWLKKGRSGWISHCGSTLRCSKVQNSKRYHKQCIHSGFARQNNSR